MYRQLCLNLLKLARRGSSPQNLPSEQSWPNILDLDQKTTTALTVTEFIARSEMDPKLGNSSPKSEPNEASIGRRTKLCPWKF